MTGDTPAGVSSTEWLAAIGRRWRGGNLPHLARLLAEVANPDTGVIDLNEPATLRRILNQVRLVVPGLRRLLDTLVKHGFLTAVGDQPRDGVGSYRLALTGKGGQPWATRNSSFDSTRPHSARVWNYFLGGKDHFEADRVLGEHIKQVFPDIVDIARESRRFLVRAVTYLTRDAGITQFLDIGTGLPTADNTHEVAQRINPEARIVYVDNDPLVLVHARALLTSDPKGETAYIDADVRGPDAILHGAAHTLDLTRPVGLMMLGILGNVEDHDQARDIVRRLVAGLVPGSYLVINDGTNIVNPAARNTATRLSIEAGTPYIARHPDQIAAYFAGLDLVEPGVVSTTRWRPDPDPATGGAPAEVDVCCGMARIP